jgi:hypothetical protein
MSPILFNLHFRLFDSEWSRRQDTFGRETKIQPIRRTREWGRKRYVVRLSRSICPIFLVQDGITPPAGYRREVTMA